MQHLQKTRGWGRRQHFSQSLKPITKVAHPSYRKTPQPGLQVIPMVRPILLAGLVAILPTMVQAQGRAMASGGSTCDGGCTTENGCACCASDGRAGDDGSEAGCKNWEWSPTRSGMMRTTRRPVGTPRHFVADGRIHKPGCSNVPGLGFDATHLAAVCGPGAFGGGRGGNVVPFFFPFFDGGFYVPSAPAAEQGAAEPQQAEDTEADVAERPRRTRVYASAQRRENEPASAGPGESQEFVFVRRDGTVFFAVAYSWESATLRYITSEGLRRSVDRDLLDLVATQQFNEQRGMNFRLPA